LKKQVEEELSRMRQETSLLAQASAERVMIRAEEETASEEPVIAEAQAHGTESARGIAAGSRARLRGLSTEGVVAAFEGDMAWLDVKGKRLRVARADLEPLSSPRRVAPSPRPPVAPSTPSSASTGGPTREVNVIGRRLDEATDEVEKALDATLMAGDARLRVIHGHGTGRLRDGLREHLRTHPAVASIRQADAREGGNGATIVELK
jgi:DNA mismatch repair protein MutS2